MSTGHTERRMAVLFVVVVGLLLWQATGLERLRPPPLRIAAEAGTQVYPVAVPPRDPEPLAPKGDARRSALERRSVIWPGFTAESFAGSPCQLFVPLSPHHWVRRPVAVAEHGDRARLTVSPRDLLDDDDGDGDLLDPGELTPSPNGADGADAALLVAEIHCQEIAR
jgi:hypothetical protein